MLSATTITPVSSNAPLKSANHLPPHFALQNHHNSPSSNCRPQIDAQKFLIPPLPNAPLAPRRKERQNFNQSGARKDITQSEGRGRDFSQSERSRVEASQSQLRRDLHQSQLRMEYSQSEGGRVDVSQSQSRMDFNQGRNYSVQSESRREYGMDQSESLKLELLQQHHAHMRANMIKTSPHSLSPPSPKTQSNSPNKKQILSPKGNYSHLYAPYPPHGFFPPPHYSLFNSHYAHAHSASSYLDNFHSNILAQQQEQLKNNPYLGRGNNLGNSTNLGQNLGNSTNIGQSLGKNVPQTSPNSGIVPNIQKGQFMPESNSVGKNNGHFRPNPIPPSAHVNKFGYKNSNGYNYSIPAQNCVKGPSQSPTAAQNSKYSVSTNQKGGFGPGTYSNLQNESRKMRSLENGGSIFSFPPLRSYEENKSYTGSTVDLNLSNRSDVDFLNATLANSTSRSMSEFHLNLPKPEKSEKNKKPGPEPESVHQSPHRRVLSTQNRAFDQILDKLPELEPFRRGSLVQLASGELKEVENLNGDDFWTSAAQQGAELKIVHCKILEVRDVGEKGEKMRHRLTLGLESYKTQVFLDSNPEQPFFVVNRGWASLSPEMSLKYLQLDCTNLKIGDVCLTLTRVNSSPNPQYTKTPSPNIPPTKNSQVPLNSKISKNPNNSQNSTSENGETRILKASTPLSISGEMLISPCTSLSPKKRHWVRSPPIEEEELLIKKVVNENSSIFSQNSHKGGQQVEKNGKMVVT